MLQEEQKPTCKLKNNIQWYIRWTHLIPTDIMIWWYDTAQWLSLIIYFQIHAANNFKWCFSIHVELCILFSDRLVIWNLGQSKSSPKIVSLGPLQSINKVLDLINKWSSHFSNSFTTIISAVSSEIVYHTRVSIWQSWLPYTVTNSYISLHCFVAKFLIQMFINVHGLK